MYDTVMWRRFVRLNATQCDNKIKRISHFLLTLLELSLCPIQGLDDDHYHTFAYSRSLLLEEIISENIPSIFRII